jgi:guanine nucleotide-binding protein G(i) subunit alpha
MSVIGYDRFGNVPSPVILLLVLFEISSLNRVCCLVGRSDPNSNTNFHQRTTMGLCASGPAGLTKEDKDKFKKAQAASAALDGKARKRADQEDTVRKLLLLGAGESGKSTVFKQMIKLYGKGFSDVDRLNFKGPLVENIVEGAYRLIVAAETEHLALQPENAASAKYISDNHKKLQQLNPMAVDHIRKVWSDPAIKEAYNRRSKFQVFDSCSYFLDKIQTIAEEKYLPSDDDLLRVRVRTTGMIQEEFDFKGLRMRMMDVGGQRNERRKWIHCFEDVTAVIFVAAISEYDQKCFEDEETNRILESINLFEETINSTWFAKTSIILFLNKSDLFRDKFDKSPLKDYFPSFEGSTADQGIEFFSNMYRSKTKKDIYPHPTTATDTELMGHVFNDVRHIIVKENLQEGGFF